MTKQEFKKMAENRILYLDGATGSNLQKRGMPSGSCPEEWIIEHKEVLAELQKEYVEAGSNVVYAPTFSANRIKLAEYGLEGKIEELNQQLVAISKEAVGNKAFVAGNLTMTGRQLRPIGTMELEELIDVYKEQIKYLDNAGVDLLVVETMMSLQETRAALIAAKEVSELPVIVTMTFEENGRALYGTDARTAAIVLESLGADAIGANCSTGPEKLAEVIKEMAEVTSVPLISKPNAGMPSLDAFGKTVYNLSPSDFAEEMKLLIQAGASILGGCCGTTPEHIKQLHDVTASMKLIPKAPQTKRYLCSERKTVSFGLEDPFLIIGERINPTGKKALQKELKEGSFDLVIQYAEEQEEQGALILDINMGMGGIDEKASMLQALEEVAGVTSLPLAIDSSHIDVVEAALRNYPGRALINSISYEKEKIEKLIPLAAKYGAMFILLPLSDKGLPESLEEKKDIIHKIMEAAQVYGLGKRDIIVDGLVTTVGANKAASLETLETIAYCKKMGLATVCGLSNISFGLPERSVVNAAFLTLAIREGLTMAIANPSQALLVSSALTADLLQNKEGADIRYIQYMTEHAGQITSGQTVKQKESVAIAISTTPAETTSEKLKEAVLKGKKGTVEELTEQVLKEGMEADVILNTLLMPSINEVGALFESGTYFLPQLIASAETMKAAIAILEPLLLQKSEQKMPVVVIATVAGDIHDIGKNLVALMLRNYGFQVIDLGKDVPRETIIQAAKEHHAEIIALSALMTTTMLEMKQVIRYAKEQGVTAKVMIGGAAITEDYATEIGADGYSKDAADAVKLAKRLLNIE